MVMSNFRSTLECTTYCSLQLDCDYALFVNGICEIVTGYGYIEDTAGTDGLALVMPKAIMESKVLK